VAILGRLEGRLAADWNKSAPLPKSHRGRGRRCRAGDFASLADYVEKFPRISAKDYRRLKKERGDLFLMDQRFAGAPMARCLSSGSSGMPAEFLRTPHESAAIDGAKTVYTFVSGGVRPWHRIMSMKPDWDMRRRRHPLQALGLFRRFDASFLEDADVIFDRIAASGVNVLTGRAGMMRKIAERAAETGREVAPMAVILPGGEMVSPQTRKLLCEVFRPRRYGELYGSTETALIALRKGEGDYQVNYRSVFFALSDPRTEAGITTGEIAVTTAFPSRTRARSASSSTGSRKPRRIISASRPSLAFRTGAWWCRCAASARS
jgi:phenylacetate-coenzyme A ligase PaaK-like adenylate-forming protein